MVQVLEDLTLSIRNLAAIHSQMLLVYEQYSTQLEASNNMTVNMTSMTHQAIVFNSSTPFAEYHVLNNSTLSHLLLPYFHSKVFMTIEPVQLNE
mmetsp:Transcript_9556/g.16045  ORF Transcript_9556/g.16045 Transcript_9556/m.16045 type:complete len:94 (+) Transcript_9556:1170-1451(+)